MLHLQFYVSSGPSLRWELLQLYTGAFELEQLPPEDPPSKHDSFF